MRIGISIFGCVLVLALSQPTVALPVDANSEDPPNIVFLLADDLGWTGLRCFGSDFYETPHLDQLASDGMKFTNAYAACTVCSPTRASIMTGKYPARIDVTDFIAGQNRPYARLRIPKWTKQLKSEHVTIAERLKSAGYQTAHIGKWHLNSRSNAQGTQPTDQGFDLSYDGPRKRKGYFLKQSDGTQDSKGGNGYLTDDLTTKACEFIDRSKGQPFFLYFAYHVPHTPIQGRPDLVKYFRSKVTAGLVHNNPNYAAMVKSLDISVGRVLERLEDHGLTDNTIVIFTSDNGGLTQRYGKHDGFTENLPLRRGKGSAYEGGVRVPAIVRWPNRINKGVVSDTPITTIDYFPTLVAIANSNTETGESKNLDGRSLVPLFRNPNHKFDRDLFWHYPHYHAGGDGPYSAVRSGNFRLVHFHEDDRLELYDLAEDIGEKNDLIKSKQNLAAALKRKLENWKASVKAQMPTPNSDFDPNKQSQVSRNKK